jgi:MPBQ/MSBQ methyltransferase
VPAEANHRREVVRYYEDTGLDYAAWSREYNMHFGYWRWPMSPLRREPMLDLMNQQVFDELRLGDEDTVVYDLGCGLAAPCRAFARRFPGKRVCGVTIVRWQVETAQRLNRAAALDAAIDVVLGDYTRLPMAGDCADGVYALESACHCEGLDKRPFVKEMMRVLKPGRRFVVVDGFVKREPETFGPLLRRCYAGICKGWALPTFPHLGRFLEALEECGGDDLVIRDCSLRIAPSVLHAPWTVAAFLARALARREKLNPVRVGHLKACLLGLVLGLAHHRFAYCLVAGVKK